MSILNEKFNPKINTISFFQNQATFFQYSEKSKGDVPTCLASCAPEAAR